jgi:hypothetical protein
MTSWIGVKSFVYARSLFSCEYIIIISRSSRLHCPTIIRPRFGLINTHNPWTVSLTSLYVALVLLRYVHCSSHGSRLHDLADWSFARCGLGGGETALVPLAPHAPARFLQSSLYDISMSACPDHCPSMSTWYSLARVDVQGSTRIPETCEVHLQIKCAVDKPVSSPLVATNLQPARLVLSPPM